LLLLLSLSTEIIFSVIEVVVVGVVEVEVVDVVEVEVIVSVEDVELEKEEIFYILSKDVNIII
jgi:hypothetical protein